MQSTCDRVSSVMDMERFSPRTATDHPLGITRNKLVSLNCPASHVFCCAGRCSTEPQQQLHWRHEATGAGHHQHPPEGSGLDPLRAWGLQGQPSHVEHLPHPWVSFWPYHAGGAIFGVHLSRICLARAAVQVGSGCLRLSVKCVHFVLLCRSPAADAALGPPSVAICSCLGRHDRALLAVSMQLVFCLIG